MRQLVIVPFPTLPSDYDELVRRCKESGDPVLLTDGDRHELIAMDVTSFRKREAILEAQSLVLEAHLARIAGEKDHSIEESKKWIEQLIKRR